jgi:hypothetical protein
VRKGGSIIEGTTTTTVIIDGSKAIVGLTICAYAFCLISFPLLKIIRGNLQALKKRGKQLMKALINEGYVSLLDARLGFCGDSVAEKVSVDER